MHLQKTKNMLLAYVIVSSVLIFSILTLLISMMDAVEDFFGEEAAEVFQKIMFSIIVLAIVSLVILTVMYVVEGVPNPC